MNGTNNTVKTYTREDVNKETRHAQRPMSDVMMRMKGDKHSPDTLSTISKLWKGR